MQWISHSLVNEGSHVKLFVYIEVAWLMHVNVCKSLGVISAHVLCEHEQN